jgi:hypothetical protein
MSTTSVSKINKISMATLIIKKEQKKKDSGNKIFKGIRRQKKSHISQQRNKVITEFSTAK